MKLKIINVILFSLAGFYCTAQQCNSPVLDTAFVYVYGGTGDDYARKIIATADSGYLVVGSSSSFGNGSSDVYVIKTDRNANKIWSKVYGTKAIEWGYDVRQAYDGGYIITGFTNVNSDYDVYLLKIDAAGNMQWSKTLGGNNWDFGYGVELTRDSGFIVCGTTYSYTNGGTDVYIVKTDSLGNMVWQKHYGGALNDSANAIIRDH